MDSHQFRTKSWVFMLAGPPGLEVALRQQLLDHATSVGLDLLTSHIHSIAIPKLSRTIHMSVLGDVQVSISNVTCTELQLRRQAAKASIVGRGFQLVVNDVSVGFAFRWAWRFVKSRLTMKGEGGACACNSSWIKCPCKMTEGKCNPAISFRMVAA